MEKYGEKIKIVNLIIKSNKLRQTNLENSIIDLYIYIYIYLN